MKHTFVCVLTCVCLLYSGICRADENLPPLKIEGVKARYSLRNSVTVTLTNPSTDAIDYGIGVLALAKDGTWTEYITNIEDHDVVRMAFLVRQLAGNKSVTHVWNPQDLRKPFPIRAGTYRFYIACKTHKEKGFGTEISHNIGSAVGKQSRHLVFSEAFELHP